MINSDIHATYVTIHDCCKKFIKENNLDEHEKLDITYKVIHNKVIDNYNIFIIITHCKNHEVKTRYSYTIQSRPKVYEFKLRKVSTYEVKGVAYK